MPEIPGLNSFKGIVMHSHNYREPEVFTGKRVACLGAGSSGQDISLDIARCAEKVNLNNLRHNREGVWQIILSDDRWVVLFDVNNLSHLEHCRAGFWCCCSSISQDFVGFSAVLVVCCPGLHLPQKASSGNFTSFKCGAGLWDYIAQ